MEQRGNTRRSTTGLSSSSGVFVFVFARLFSEVDSVAMPLSYLSQVHLVISKLGNCKNKSVQMSSHIRSIYKE